jgi:hypothetical protein
MAPEPDKVIVECPNCRQSLSIPPNRRKLHLTCPKCRANWLWSSEGAGTIQAFEVRPRAKRNAVIVAVLSALFTFGGLWMLLSGQDALPALLGTALGVLGLSAAPKMWRRDVSMILTQQGLEQRYPKGSTLIAWTDVEQIGVMRVATNKMVGVRLRSYDRYLNGMPAELAEFMMKSLRGMKLLARGASMVHLHGGVGLWLAAEQRGLKSFGKVGSLGECMMWSRQQYGYDLGLSWADLDRSPNKFVTLLEEYRRRA